MDGSSGNPTSGTKKTGGDTNCCPAKATKLCKPKKLKVTITPKKRSDSPGSQQESGKGWAPAMKPPEPFSLEATEAINRVHGSFDKMEAAFQQSRRAFMTGKGTDPQTAALAADGKQIVSQASGQALAWLRSYDLVIETLASFLMAESRPANSIDIEVQGEHEGPCAMAAHPTLSITPMSDTGGQIVKASPAPKNYAADFKIGPAGWPVGTLKFSLKDVHAASLAADVKAAPNALAAALKFISVGKEFLSPMDLSIALRSCGVRDQTKFDPAEMNALVRVYRETNFQLGIKIPARLKREWECTDKASSWNDKISVSDPAMFEIREATSRRGGASNTTTTTVGGPDRYKVTNESGEIKKFEIFLKLNELEVNVTELAEKAADLKKTYDEWKNKPKSGPTFKEKAGAYAALLSMSEGAFGFALGIAMLARDFKRVWQATVTAITGFFDVMKRVPQMGFSIKTEVSFLAGSIAAFTQTAQGEASGKLAQRYRPIKWKFGVEFGLTILELKAEVSFGILVDFPIAGRIDIRVKGEIAGAVSLKSTIVFFNADPDDKCLPIGAQGKVTGRLSANASFESWYYTFKREIGIEAGISVDLGLKLFPKKCEYSAGFSTLPVLWYFVCVDSRNKTSETKVHRLFEPTLIYEAKGLQKWGS
ncbi:MAG: hypothetical protein U0271_32290 [Polyangiaceae bacterium]